MAVGATLAIATGTMSRITTGGFFDHWRGIPSLCRQAESARSQSIGRRSCVTQQKQYCGQNRHKSFHRKSPETSFIEGSLWRFCEAVMPKLGHPHPRWTFGSRLGLSPVDGTAAGGAFMYRSGEWSLLNSRGLGLGIFTPAAWFPG
jgi:hypothetical protein